MAVSAADKKKLGKWIKQAREKKQPHLSQRAVSTGCRYHKRFSQLD